ncbi:MAG TPA: TetR/AcrR family transcriptional regulator [Planctomycetes bacterium]|nr:TetR/AcrR family transcriptional regulator [Planctomycetota bacterium]
MGRPREFDIDEALDAAIEVFWEHGYDATCNDLLGAMGIQKGSLYKAFGSKHNLFMAALDRYLSASLDRIEGIFKEAPSPKAGLENWLQHGVLDLCSRGVRRGCFGINSAVELGVHDEEVAQRFRRHIRDLKALLGRVIAEGQERGEFRLDIDPRAAAEFVFVVLAGLLTASKGGMSRAEGQRVIALASSALEGN